MASTRNTYLVWKLLVLCTVTTVALANLREFRELVKIARAAEIDDEDIFEERQLGSGSGSASGSGGQQEVCDEAALARICAGVCARAHCRDYPEATCRPRSCEDCTPVWSVHGQEVANCTGRPLVCPGLWVAREGHCYRVQNRYGLPFKAAQKYCLRQGGHLVAINDMTEQRGVESLYLKNFQVSYWTAGYKPASTSTWVWQLPDGNHPLTYTYWASGEPNDKGYEGIVENRIALHKSSSRWKWNDVTATAKLYPICEAIPDKIQTHCDSKPCMNGGSCVAVSEDMYRCDCSRGYAGKYCELYASNSAWNHFEGHLYLVHKDYALTRYDAEAYCAMHNAYLLSINTERESDFIKGLLDKLGVSDPTYRFYTGGYSSYPGGRSTIQWADGTTLESGDFKDWGRGEPNSSNERYLMLKFYTENDQWAWNDTPGSWLGEFICEKSASVQATRTLHRKGILRTLFHKKWTHPHPTMEY